MVLRIEHLTKVYRKRIRANDDVGLTAALRVLTMWCIAGLMATYRVINRRA